ncbi:MAG: aldo/keto reductase [Microbacteriaceae bacterium]|nr:aldo/keto reductase [Microbacteriaceae bacterium]
MKIPDGQLSLTLNTGDTIPQLGLGVFKVDDDVCEQLVLDALEVGYRHIDTAMIYRNEAAVGRALAASGIARDEIFVTTKLWNSDQGTENTPVALQTSLELLGLDYVDLYLIHWPAPLRDDYVATWLALEELHAQGLAKAIGVSNFEPEHLEKIMEAGSITPAINQVELHPAFQQRTPRAFQEPLGIITEAWGPLGQGKYELSELPGLVELAKAKGRSIQQIVLRWHLQEGVVVFPKTARKERLVENLSVFDFDLTAEEMDIVAAMDINKRVGTHPDDGNW